MTDKIDLKWEEIKKDFDKLMSNDTTKEILFKALKAGAKSLEQNTRKLFRSAMGAAARHPNRWNGKTMESGIRMKADKAYIEAMVAIMGDFRLKFFEKGTAERQTKGRKILGYYKANGKTYHNKLQREGKGHRTGRIKAMNFFATARSDENTIQDIIFKNLDNEFHKLFTK